MNFSDMLCCLKQNKKTSKRSWSSKEVYLYILKDYNAPGGKKVMIHYGEDDFVDDFEYKVTSEDLFALDWFVV